jgi:hypothetical protein
VALVCGGLNLLFCIWGLADSKQPIRGCKLVDCVDSADPTTAKAMVQMKNLFRQKDSLGPCLEGAKVKKQLLVYSKLEYQVRYLFYGLRLYKGVSGRDTFSAGSHTSQRQQLLYKKQRRQKKLAISVRCEQ